MVRGVTSVLTCYLTTFGQPLLSTEFVVFVFSCFAFLFYFLTLSSYFLSKTFFRRLWFLPVHWYHLSLSVSIIYHKIFHISISFLYKITYIVFMQKVETPQIPQKPLTCHNKICYNGYVRRPVRGRLFVLYAWKFRLYIIQHPAEITRC